ncbi:MAG: crossover junction endodeoxyribonuclease RuvC [Candidatus Liptonbacteria bacterium]|nr:crossover junction endodeoxyribonuclease RuvC [Candidatus Liptonbacteria bacterium]
MIILGIDPGSRRIGYGAVGEKEGVPHCLTAGLLSIQAGQEADALAETKQRITRILKVARPTLLAVEKLYFVRNQSTAVAVAEHRGVILLSAREEGIPVREYAPSEVKAGIAGYGLADKRAVAKMVHLAIKGLPTNLPDDVTDALALALFAFHREKVNARMGSGLSGEG